MYSYFQTIAFCLFSLPIVIKDVKVMKIPIVYSYAGLLLLLTIDVIVVKESVLMGIGGMASLFVLFIIYIFYNFIRYNPINIRIII